MFPTRFPANPDQSADLFGAAFSWASGSSSSSPPPFPDDLVGLTASFLGLDLEAFGRDALGMQHARPDLSLIRQDFVRNGIDSAIPGRSVRRRPPGFVQEPVSCPRWPLNSLENVQTPAVVEQPAKPVPDRSRHRRQKENEDYCVFCFNNGEPQEVYMSHVCRDERGLVQCPRLRRYVCPYCRATDRNAHTKKYCPNKPIITPEDLLKMPMVTAAAPAATTTTVQPSPEDPVPSVTKSSKRSLRF